MAATTRPDHGEQVVVGDRSARTRSDRGDLVDAMRELAALRDRDVLTETEFQRARVKVVDERLRWAGGAP